MNGSGTPASSTETTIAAARRAWRPRNPVAATRAYIHQSTARHSSTPPPARPHPPATRGPGISFRAYTVPPPPVQRPARLRGPPPTARRRALASLPPSPPPEAALSTTDRSPSVPSVNPEASAAASPSVPAATRRFHDESLVFLGYTVTPIRVSRSGADLGHMAQRL